MKITWAGQIKKVGNEAAARVSAYRVAIYFRRFRDIGLAVGLYVSEAGFLLDHPVGEHWATTVYSKSSAASKFQQ